MGHTTRVDERSIRVRAAALIAVLTLSCAWPLRAQLIKFTRVSPDVLEGQLKRVSRDNKTRGSTLRQLFEEAGCVELTEQKAKGLATPNVICTLLGEQSDAVVVGAHYDKVPVGDGLIDNWSGAVMLPNLFVALKSAPRRLTFIFVGFSDEEKGLRGSRAYVKQVPKESRRNIKAMVNLECLGSGPVVAAPSQSDKLLVRSLAVVAHSLGINLGFTNVDKVGTSDQASFADAKIPVIQIHSISQETFPLLHNNRDNLTALRLKDYDDAYQLIAAYLAYLDVTWAKPEEAQPPEK